VVVGSALVNTIRENLAKPGQIAPALAKVAGDLVAGTGRN
jgi:tryptophan synthase alpha subunit